MKHKMETTMADPEESDGSDEWGVEEVIVPHNFEGPKDEKQDERDKGDDDYWNVESTKSEASAQPDVANQPSEPMIIVDVTRLDPNIHSQFDKNSVNDSSAASALRKKIESDYASYSKDSSLLSDGTIIPCGSTVWRDALVRLREERPGHYFAPIFPPSCKK